MTANFTPTQNSYKELGQFRFWCQKVLPLTYDDSLSYYELLCKVVNILNETIQNVELMGDDINKVYTAYNELEVYTNDYFTNLDVQEEINNKLDEMASDGSLGAVVEPYIPIIVTSWLNENVDESNGVVDNSLSISGASADAKIVGTELKNTGKIFRLITGIPASLTITHLNGVYTVKWTTDEERYVLGVCGSNTCGIANYEYGSSFMFTELTITQSSGYVALVYNVINKVFVLKKLADITKDDYACVIMYQNIIDFLGNDEFFDNITAQNLYNVRKSIPLFSRKCEILQGSFDVNINEKTLTGKNVVLAYGNAGQFSSSQSFEISLKNLADIENIWYLFFNYASNVFEVLDYATLLNIYKTYEFRNYYFVFGYLKNKYYGIQPYANRFLVNGVDNYDNMSASLDLAIGKIVNGYAGQLELSYDESTKKYKLKWVDEIPRYLYCLLQPVAMLITNSDNEASLKCKFTEIESAEMGDIGVYVVLTINKYTGEINFKYVYDVANGDYAIALMFRDYINYLGNDKFFNGWDNGSCYEARKYTPFLSRKAEIIRGGVNIDTSEMRVYTSTSLSIVYSEVGGFHNNITFDIDLNTLKHPNYVWYCMYNANTKTVEIMGYEELSEMFNSLNFRYLYLLFSYYNGNIYYTSMVNNIYFVNGYDYFAGKDTFTRYKLLSNKTYKIFRKVVCCGDSLTSGYIVDGNGVAHRTNEDYSWVHYMGTDSGNQYINCGESGSNVLTWQSAERGLIKARNTGVSQAYIIGLGMNDSSTSSRLVEVGNVNDIGTDNATYYGGLSKIIRELKTISPQAIIFVQNIPRTGATFAPYNQAIKDIVDAYHDTYRVHLLDLYSHMDLYRNPAITEDALSGHYTAIGYEVFAQNLSHIMSEYINDNITEFQDVAFLPYD